MKITRNYLIALTIIIPVIIFLLMNYIGSPGHLIFHDITEGINENNIIIRYFYSFSNNIGSTLVELSRIPIFSTILLIFKLLLSSTEFYIKIKIYLLYIASIGAFFYSIRIFSQYIKNKVDSRYMIFALIASSLIYVVNPWMNNRVVHFFLFFASVNIPLVTSLFYDLLYGEKINSNRLLLLLITLGTTIATPHIFLIDAVIMLCISIVFICKQNNFRENAIRFFKVISVIGIPAILLSLYWLLPYLSSGGEIPDRAESIDILLLLSRNANLLNSLRLISYWWINPHVYFSEGYLIGIFQVFVSYLLPILFLSFVFILRKNRVIQTFLLLFIVTLFLSSGTMVSISFYKTIIFNSLLSQFGWLLREIDKFGIILAYLYSLGIYFLIILLINKSRKYIYIIFILILFIAGFNLKHLNYVLTTDFKPSIIPNDFQMVNDYLAQDPEDCNVIWYPGVSKSFWAQTDDNPYAFSQLSSSKPIANTNSSTKYYVNYLFDEKNIDQINLGKALDLIGAKYVIVRDDDVNISQTALINKLISDVNFNLKFETQIIKVFENLRYSGLSNAFTTQIKTNLGYEFLKYLDELNVNTDQTYINFTDSNSSNLINLPINQYIIENGDSTDFAMSGFNRQFIYPFKYSNRAQPNQAWAKGSLTDLTHAEAGYYLNERNIHNAQLDFGNGIIMAYDQYQLKNHQTIDQVKGIPIKNSIFPNVTYNNNSIIYDFDPITEQNPYWKIIRSNKVDLKGVNNPKALSVFGDVDVSYDVNVTQPHLKITFYDQSDNLISIEHLTPDDIQKINTYFKIPVNTNSFDISLWSAALKIPYTVTWNTLNIEDISNYVEPILLSIPIDNNQCQVNCYLITRSLKSHRGGEVEYIVNSKSFFDKTVSNYNRFTWSVLGIVNYAQNVEIINRSGFNAVNAFTLIPISDYENALNQINNSIKNTSVVINIYNADSALPITNDSRGIFLGLGTSSLSNSIPLLSEHPIQISFKTHVDTPFMKNNPEISQNGTILDIQNTIFQNESVAQFPSIIIRQGTLVDTQTTIKLLETEINPTKHTISIDPFTASNLSSLITYKKPYSPNWRLTELNNQKPMIVYGQMNGWLLDHPQNSLTIEYLPQKYFYIGSIISIIALGLILIVWIILKRRQSLIR